MSNYNVEISADSTITVGLPSTGNGVAGPRGEKGYSAYEVAVKNGYTGTEAEWLATLKGDKGDKGEPGANGSDGKPGKDGVDGANGADGKPGVNGLSAYELAAKNGFTGNESSWLASLKGDKGDQGPKGNDGQNGVNGVDGKDGLSAYSIAVKNGYSGTEEEWVNKWLRGTIVSADVNDDGFMSMTDINGNVINTNLAPIAKAASSASAAEASAQAAANSASEAATHDTNAATSLAETRKSEQNAKTSEQNAAASAAQAAENARTLQADWNQTDETQTDYVKNKPTGFSVLYEVGLFELSKDNFYPIVFYPSNYILRCEIHSPSSDASNDYNQNVLSFRLLKTGWGDTPYSFFVETYDVYDANEITIGCIGYGQEQGNVVVWVRGGMKYRIISNRKPIIYPNGFSQNNEIFTVGPNYFGGYDYQKLSICFTPQETVKKGPWYDGIFSGTFDRAVCDVDGNSIKGTYLKKSLAEQSFTTNTLTATDAAFTGQTIVPTANEGNSSNAIASTEFVAKSIAALVNSAPETLNTLNELATALGNDPNFATTVTNALAKKMNEKEATDTFATKTEVSDLQSSTVAKTALWEALHSQDSATLTGLTNNQWNALGLFLRYFTTTGNFENQPTQYGQLLNIPADKGDESTQLWIEQSNGRIYARGGNASKAVKDEVFKQMAFFNSDGHLVFPNGAEMWVY